jgi:hypothetical protein
MTPFYLSPTQNILSFTQLVLKLVVCTADRVGLHSHRESRQWSLLRSESEAGGGVGQLPPTANRPPTKGVICPCQAVRDISAAEASESIPVWSNQSVTVPVRPLPTENCGSELLNLNLAYFTESFLPLAGNELASGWHTN